VCSGGFVVFALIIHAKSYSKNHINHQQQNHKEKARISICIVHKNLFDTRIRPRAHTKKKLRMAALLSDSGQVPVRLRIASFNIWRGGTQVNFGSIVEAIQAADPDIIGIQEAEGNIEKLATALGWSNYSKRMHVLSKYPLFDPPGCELGAVVAHEGQFGGPYAFVEIASNKFVVISNLHLPSTADGSEALEDGAAASNVMESEINVRQDCVLPIVDVLTKLVDRWKLPVFLTGDFNSPSHLDCDAAVDAAIASAGRERNGRGGGSIGASAAVATAAAAIFLQTTCALDWPATASFHAAGFQDSYRAIFPSPAKNPGLTWTCGYPAPYIKEGEVLNRIDFIFTKCPPTSKTSPTPAIETVGSFLVGESGRHMWKQQHINKDVQLSVSPWGSDHRMVVSDFQVVLAAAPFPMLSVRERRIPVGTLISINVSTAGCTTLRMGLFRVGRPKNASSKKKKKTKNKTTTGSSSSLVPDDALISCWVGDGTDRRVLSFSSGSYTPGAYKAVLWNDTTNKLEQQQLFWIVAAEQVHPSLHLDQTTYVTGDLLRVTWTGGWGNKWDWIGLFEAQERDVDSYVCYTYLNGAVQGSIELEWTAPADHDGAYELRMFSDDSYTLLATVPFRMQGGRR